MMAKLADPGGVHYIRVNPVLEFTENKKLEEEISEKNYLIKDSILCVMRSKLMSDVQSVQGSGVLKNQLLPEINKHLKNGQVENIYYVEFLVQ